MYRVTKTYGHDLGLSACFRQWRAQSHCAFLHGYALSFKLTFESTVLDENGWVINFGGLKIVKSWLEDRFDHKLQVALDDPDYARLMELARIGLAKVTVSEKVGCEAFAKQTWDFVENFLTKNGYSPRVSLVEVEVREHGANSAIYRG